MTTKHSPLKRKFSFSPAQVLVMGFASIILVGTILLSLPISVAQGRSPHIIDSLFTATSAVCVTGLIVADTGKDFSYFGQGVILILLQIGGLGYMTMATLTALFVGKRITLKDRIVMQEALNQFNLRGLVRFTLYIVKITLIFEVIGAVILSAHWMKVYSPLKAIYYGIFHSVSAFCNAGFSLFTTNLGAFTKDPVVVLVVSTLFIIGGIGYIVVSDLYMYRKTRRLLTHTKFALSITAGLILIGTAVMFVLEYKNPATLGNLSLPHKLLASYFQAVTARTAGFNTLNISSFTVPALFLLVMLMFIGASPGGTGGGIKTTTFGTVVADIWATLRGKREVNVFKRRINQDAIRKAFTVLFMGIALVVLVTMLLLMIEKKELVRTLFEVISAFGTVGLSAAKGISLSLSSTFSAAGKLLIIITMFVGRLGPLTLGMAVIQGDEKTNYKYAEERVLIG
ncbi:MAG: TrkH family potassium uptake protein [bacterium]